MPCLPRNNPDDGISGSRSVSAFSSSLGGERAGELAERLLMAFVRDLREVARELKAHPLTRRNLPALLGVQPFEEVIDRHAQYVGDLEQPSGRDAVDAALIFVRLLIGHADEVGQLLLGESEHDAALAYPRADMTVDVLCAAARAAHGSPPRTTKRRGRLASTRQVQPVLVRHVPPPHFDDRSGCLRRGRLIRPATLNRLVSARIERPACVKFEATRRLFWRSHRMCFGVAFASEGCSART